MRGPLPFLALLTALACTSPDAPDPAEAAPAEAAPAQVAAPAALAVVAPVLATLLGRPTEEVVAEFETRGTPLVPSGPGEQGLVSWICGERQVIVLAHEGTIDTVEAFGVNRLDMLPLSGRPPHLTPPSP